MSSSDDESDVIVQCLVGIGAELTQIRQELQRMNGDEPEAEPAVPDSDGGWTCRACGAAFTTLPAAERHARDDHGAPTGAEQDILA